jgi:hypothetical protein
MVLMKCSVRIWHSVVHVYLFQLRRGIYILFKICSSQNVRFGQYRYVMVTVSNSGVNIVVFYINNSVHVIVFDYETDEHILLSPFLDLFIVRSIVLLLLLLPFPFFTFLSIHCDSAYRGNSSKSRRFSQSLSLEVPLC